MLQCIVQTLSWTGCFSGVLFMWLTDGTGDIKVCVRIYIADLP